MANHQSRSSKKESLDAALASTKESLNDALTSKRKASDKALALKLDAERRKSEAERVKLWLEAEEIRKRLHRKWYQETTTILKWTAAGLVAGTLVISWVVGYLRPVLEYQQEVASLRAEAALLESQKVAHQNAIEKAQNEQKIQELKREDETIKEELAFLASERENLQALLTRTEEDKTQLAEHYVKLASNYDDLAQRQEFTERQRVQFADLAKSISAEAEALNRDIEKVHRAVQDSEARVRTIQTQLDTREIRGTKTRIVHNRESTEDAAQIGQRLTDLGADVQVTPSPEIGWAFGTTLYYYDDSKLMTAVQIQKAIADIVQVEMVRGRVPSQDWVTPTPVTIIEEPPIRSLMPLASWVESTFLKADFELVLMLD
ncbi:MAG: hypothetical protein ACE1ZI_00555 [Acidobacteriota bacterium]